MQLSARTFLLSSASLRQGDHIECPTQNYLHLLLTWVSLRSSRFTPFQLCQHYLTNSLIVAVCPLFIHADMLCEETAKINPNFIYNWLLRCGESKWQRGTSTRSRSKRIREDSQSGYMWTSAVQKKELAFGPQSKKPRWTRGCLSITILLSLRRK